MKKSWIQPCGIALLTVLAYLPAMQAGFIWDDDYHVTRNFSLRSTAGLVELWTRPGVVPQYYPVTHTAFWLQYHLWGLNPAGYHVVNILLHALSGVLLWRILCRLEIPGAWIAAAIWALHPVNVESVAWVTELKNVLSGVLYLSALLIYVPIALADPPPERFAWKRYTLVLLLFTLAILSKSVTASLPAAILLIIWWKRGRIEVRDLVPLLPLFALGIGMGYCTSQMEKSTVGASGPEWNFSTADRILIAGRAVWFYAAKLLWPSRLTFIYPRWKIDPHQVWQWIYPVAALGLVVAGLVFRKFLGRGPLIALLFFGGTLFPALGFINVYPMRYSFVADHFQYLAAISLIVMIAAAGARWMRRPVGVGLSALVLVALGVLTFRQTLIYRDLETLWSDTLAKNPDSWMARNNYARLLLGQARHADAEPQIRRSLELNPTNSEAITNLGILMEARGRNDDAIEAYRSAIESSGGDAITQFRLGRLLIATGKVREGMYYLNHAMEIYPTYAPAHEELARILFASGRMQDAIAELERAVELDPDLITAQYRLAALLLEAGHTPDNDPRLRELMQRLPTTKPKR